MQVTAVCAEIAFPPGARALQIRQLGLVCFRAVGRKGALQPEGSEAVGFLA